MDGPRSKLISKTSFASQKSPSTKKTSQATQQQPTELDLQVAKALWEIQSSSADLASELKALQFYGAKEVEVGSRKSIVIQVPVPQIKAWRRIQLRVVRELEKKLNGGDASGKQVILIGFRRIQAKPKHGVKTKQARPRSRTLTAVHDAWLEDMVYPTEIVGKRIRVKTDGRRTIKILLDPKDQTSLESKLDVYAGVYRKLTGKDVIFDFPVSA